MFTNGTTPEVTVLTVEDSSTQAAQIEAIVRALGYGTQIAGNGRDALGIMRQCPPAIVISDIAMPVMDGLQICRAAKMGPDVSAIPVILLTALTTAIRGQAVGAPGTKAQAYLEEGRLLALQPMGSLAQFYRGSALHYGGSCGNAEAKSLAPEAAGVAGSACSTEGAETDLPGHAQLRPDCGQ